MAHKWHYIEMHLCPRQQTVAFLISVGIAHRGAIPIERVFQILIVNGQIVAVLAYTLKGVGAGL